jgi:rare lipoprotein A
MKLTRFGVVPLAVLGLVYANAALAEHEGHSFSGGAHWYGKELHGHRTASGAVFDKDKLTAAHPSLKFGTKVKVVSKLTGKSVVVEINDRCPHRSYRCIDLSEGAAKEIGIYPHKKNDVECHVVSGSAAKE